MGAIGLGVSGNVSNVDPRRSERARPRGDNDAAIAGIDEILLPGGEAERARSGMIRFSL
jgi:hypothetical protein